MSQIKLSSNPSGTGIFTLESPATNTNRTLTLPDATGTIITTAGGAAISGTTGAFTTTVGVGGATPAASGAGITFPATASASSDANTLDDYEEGTWTPSLGGNTTYNNQTGNYTKIGRQVTVRFRLDISSIGTGSTTLISGLPFTVGVAGWGSAYWDTSVTNIVTIVAYARQSEAAITLWSATAASASLGTSAIFKNATTVDGTITYFV
jgi:hypothetical protein